MGNSGDTSAVRTARSRRRVAGLVALALIGAAIGAVLWSRVAAEPEPGEPTVTWADTEAEPACVYDDAAGRVNAGLVVDPNGSPPRRLTVTVTAYADENTSQPVGSATRTLDIEGTSSQRVMLAIEVGEPPFVDIDGVAACSLAVR